MSRRPLLPLHVLACLILLFGTVAAEGARRKVIVDQDAYGPGGPNLQPILMVLQSPSLVGRSACNTATLSRTMVATSS